MFTNLMREQEDRTLNQRRRIGIVVNNDDSKHPDGQKLQRITVRLPDLHDDIEDSDLPYFTPGGLDAFSGGSDVGNHGPIPPVGAKVYVRFEDDSQYHGQYLGGVAHTDNQIAEFTGQSTSTPASTTGAGTAGDDNSDSGDQATDLKQTTAYDFAKDYPMAHGGVDVSGNFFGHSTKADFTERTLVSGTSLQTDGVGNMHLVVNGNAQRTDNSDAKQKLPEGFSALVFGGGTVYISKSAVIQVMGDATIQANGSATVSAQGSATVQANGDATVSAKGGLELIAGKKAKVSGAGGVVLVGPTIELAGQVIGPVPSGSSSASASSPLDSTKLSAQTAPTPRKRPASTTTANNENY